MADQAAGERKTTTVNARVDADYVRRLDKLATLEGTVNYRRSRSQLIELAITEYVNRHEPKGTKGPAK